VKKHRARSSLIAALDVGSSKICCFIARIEDGVPRIVGIGHQVSHGVRGGLINDIEAASQAILSTVHAAEEMAGETVPEVVVNLSAGFAASRIVKAEIALNGREATGADIRRVLHQGYALKEQPDRQVVHSIPVGFSIDDSRGIRDPRGLFGQRLGVNMNVVAAKAGPVRNLANAIGRCHLEVAALVVSPYAAGLSVLVPDEIGLGVTLIDMGGGTTSIAVFYDGNMVFADVVPVGGIHVTKDIACGLSTPPVHAERMKTLYGSAMVSPSDEREMITVPQIGADDEAEPAQIKKSLLVGIIAPRLEETFELVRNSLEASGFDKIAGRRVVLTGGAAQLVGTRELAALILDKQVRIGRPTQIAGLAEATGGPAFASAAGLVQFALSESAEPLRQHGALAEEPNGLFGRFGIWIREHL
jgi:cell division protein FtsA